MLFELPATNQNDQAKNNEWYTPARYTDAARMVMGSIDLDPASCELANQTIKATHIYTKETNGLLHPWHGNVWLNPPYLTAGTTSSYTIWTQKLISEYDSGNTKQAILLIPHHGERAWFQPLYRGSICQCNHQIMFVRPGLPPYHLYHGLDFVYLGPNIDAFVEHFLEFGPIAPRFILPKEKPATRDLWTELEVSA